MRKGLQPESVLEIEDRCAPSLDAIAISAIQILEYTDHLLVHPGDHEPLNALRHPQPSRPKWRFPLFGLLCAVLSFTIFAWGTAYKLSLYKIQTNSAPAKVCMRGSDAAKSVVGQAINGRKVFGNGVATPMNVSFPIPRLSRHVLAVPKGTRGIVPLRFEPVLAARPPPIIRLFFS